MLIFKKRRQQLRMAELTKKYEENIPLQAATLIPAGRCIRLVLE